MAGPVLGFDPLVARLISALGLEPAETEKVVIEIAPDQLVKVYAVLLPGAEDLRRVAEAIELIPVADVTVSDRGEVAVTPLESKPE